MKRIFKLVDNIEILRFVIIGVINTMNHYVVYYSLLYIGIDYKISFTTGYIISLFISFFLNTRFTYRVKPTFKRFMMYPISYIPNFIMQSSGVLLMVEYFSISEKIAPPVATILAIPITYFAMKFILGKDKHKESTHE